MSFKPQPVIHSNGLGGIRCGFNSRPISDQAYPGRLGLSSNPATSSCSVMQPPSRSMGIYNDNNPLPQGCKNTDHQTTSGDQVPHRMSFQITSAPPLQRRSQMEGIQTNSPARENSEHTCQNPVNDAMISSPALLALAQKSYGIARPYARVAVHDLLNTTHSPFACFQSSVKLHTQNFEISPADTNAHMRKPGSMRSQSFSTFSTASSSTLNVESHIYTENSFHSAEQRCFLLNTLYDICVDATTSHAISLLAGRRRRNRRYRPYSSKIPRHRIRSTVCPRSEHGTRFRGKTTSLMDNISAICTHLWRKARRDAMAPHRAEADAVREMRDLYAWGELVARGMDSDGLLDSDSDRDGGNLREENVSSSGDGDSGTKLEGGESGKGSGNMDTLMRIGRAAKRICDWVRNPEAWDSCQLVVDELMDVAMRGRGKDVIGIGIVEDGNEDGEDRIIY